VSMRTDDFDYNLPEELIAQAPAEPRDSCRLLVVDRKGSQAGTPLEHGGTVEHRIFRDIIDYIEPGDVLVINQTRVMPARLIGRKTGSGGVVETLLLKRREDVDPLGHVWECLVKPGKRLKPGAHIEYRAGGAHAPEGAPVVLTAEVVDFVTDSRGGRLVRFEPAGCNAAGEPRTLDEAIHAAGHVPLPPYITDYEGDPEESALLTGVFNRLARSCFYGVAVKEGNESPYRNGCIPAGAASAAVVEAAEQAALAFEQAMYKFETHRALAVCDDYLRAANKRWSDASKAANKLEGEPANTAMKQALVDAFTELRVATVLMHGIVPAGCELICEYFDVDPVAFFSWDNIFASTDEFVESLGEKPGEHRVKPLPPRFDFFSKHESQY
jgi:hypothetical protein